MKKGKILAVALIGLMLAGGLALASCRSGCDGAGTCSIDGGKGSYCSNYKINYSSGAVSGCAANKALVKSQLGKSSSGQCDC